MDSRDPTLLVFDEFAIDFAGLRLLRGGAEQPLEPKAFGVLALLAGTPGRVFARDEILDAVWGHRHVTPGVLNRVMTLLRHALGEDAQGARYLHTVHGVGYRFDLPESVSTMSAQAATPVPAHPEPMRETRNRPRALSRIVLWALPLLALLAFGGWMLWLRHSPAPATAAAIAVPATERSIAVLPLANASKDPEQQFFSDGLSDSLISALSRFDGLRVIGRMSSFQFRDGKDDSKTIGAKLGATYLLNGSVQRAGDVVRINTTLTKAADGSTLWAEHYDRPYKDLFALQDEIAQAIANTLHAKLLSAEAASRQSDRPPSGNIAAYDAYLRGMRSLYHGDLHKVLEYQNEATRLDPGYAAAWAQLTVGWTIIGENEDLGSDAAKAAFAKAHAAANTALRLSPDLGLAHGALGNLHFTDVIDWRGALAELGRAVELAPNDGQIHGGFSRVLVATGRVREAIEHRQRFVANEPLVAGGYSYLAPMLASLGRLEEAENDLNIAQELAPGPIPSPQYMYLALLRGNAKAALRIAEAQPSPWREADLALVAQLGPDHAAADAVLAKVIENGTWKKTSPYVIAQAYALRGDADKTMEWLERTWTMRDTNIQRLMYDPLILRFRKNPQLIAFCKKIGLPPPDASEALSIDQIRASLAAKR